MIPSERVKLVAKVLKKNHLLTGGMTDEQAIVLAYKIMEALERPVTKVEVKPPNDAA
jgi:hypothetical protein